MSRQPAAAAKRFLHRGAYHRRQFDFGRSGKGRSSITKSSMMASSRSYQYYYSSLSLSPPLWASFMDKLLQRPNVYLHTLEMAGILLPTSSSSSLSSSSADFAYSHLNESTSRLLAQPHYAQAAVQHLVRMYQHDYSSVQDMQNLARLEIPLAALAQLMKLSQHVLIPPDSAQQHPALWHSTWQALHRDVGMQQERIRRDAACGKVVLPVSTPRAQTSKTTEYNSTICRDRTNQDTQWENKFMMHQLQQVPQRQSYQQAQDYHDHAKNDATGGSNRLDWQEALREVQHDLLTTTFSTIHCWQPHHYEQYPMEFRYKLKNRTQRLELIRNLYNLIGLRQTLAATTASNDIRHHENHEPYKHYADQVFRNDCRRLAQSLETVESFLKTTSRELKAYMDATKAPSMGGALSEFIQPQRHEQLILRRRQEQRQQQQQRQQQKQEHHQQQQKQAGVAVKNEDVEQLQQDNENYRDEQNDLPDEAKMLQLHHHVTLDGALDLVFRLSQDLFGVTIVQDSNGNARFWNPDVRLYHIYNHDDDNDDISTGNKQYLGSFFLDPYHRPGKMPGWSGHIPLYGAGTATDRGPVKGGHATAVVVVSLQLEPPVWSDNPARVDWKQARELFSQLGHVYQWILSTQSSSSSLISFAKSPANMAVDLVPVIPKFMEHWLYEKSTIYGLLAASASASLSGPSSSLADFTDESINAAHRVLSRQKALELSRHIYFSTLELQIFSNVNLLQQQGVGGGNSKEHETIMALQNRLAREMLPDELFSALYDNEDDLTPLCHILCSDAASDNHHFTNAVAWYRHVLADAVSAHILQQLQTDYDNANDNLAKTLVMKRWREKFRNVLLDRGAAVDMDEFKLEFGLQEVLCNNHENDDTMEDDTGTDRPSLRDALFRRYFMYHV